MTKRKLQLYPIIIIILSLCAVIVGRMYVEHVAALQAPQPTALKDYKLAFNDDFDGQKLDTNKWATCYDWALSASSGCTNFGNNELQWYLPRQVSVSGGSLHLVAEKRPTVGTDSKNNSKTYSYSSGMVTTGKPSKSESSRWMNQYGYYEIRTNAPEGKGIWPAFWLIPADNKWPPEIDIMEILGDKPNQVMGTYFWGNAANPSKDSAVHTSKEKYTNSWHTYGVNWEEGSLDWYVDGQKVRGIKGKYVPKEPLMMVINIAVGGNLPGNPDDKTKFPAALLVDYVRVYKKS